MDLSNHGGFATTQDHAIPPPGAGCTPLSEAESATEALQLALESAGAGVWEADLEAKTVSLSRQCIRMLGLPDDHSGVLRHEDWLKVTAGPDELGLETSASPPVSVSAAHCREFRITGPDGEPRRMRISGSYLPDPEGHPRKMVGVLFDDTDSRLAQKPERESDARVRQVQEAALIASFITGADQRIFGSREYYRNLGLPEDTEFIDRETLLGLIHPDDRRFADQAVRLAVQSADGHDIEYRIHRADTGELRWIFSRLRFERASDGALIRIVGVHLDVTEAKRAGAALNESEARLSLIQEAALIGTYITRPDRTLVGSRQFYRNLGLPEDTEFIERETHLGLIHPDDRERVVQEAANAARSADGYDTKYRIYRADTGELRWIFSRRKFERASDGTVIRIVGAHLDVTETQRAEAALHESEARLNLIQEAALIGTYVTQDDRTIVGSMQYYRNLGLPEETEFIDRETHRRLIHPDDRDRVEQEVIDEARSGDGYDTKYRIMRADTGEIRWIFSRRKFERTPDGELIRIVGAHLDITESERAEAALHESVAFNQTMIESSADCVMLFDVDGRLRFMNEQGLAALEIEDAASLLGRDWAELLPRTERAKAEAAVEAARSGQTGRFDAAWPTATGKPKWWDVVVTSICDRRGQPRQLLAISRDITEHRRNLEQIRWTASHDMLTELPNRRYFHSRLEQNIADAAATGASIGLLQIDVDNFKQVNDALGHDAGDALLKTFSRRLQSATQGSEMVARLGGDEFAVIVPDLTVSRSLTDIVTQIQAHLAEPFIYQGRVLDCRASIGKALFPQHGKTVEDLLKSTDIALYAAKTSGRGHVRRFHPSMRADLDKRSAMVNRARAALKNDLVFPFYQPKIDLKTGALAGFEALLRWQDRNRKIQLPARIAAAFQELDVAQALSERMQLRVLADMRRWLDEGVDFGHVAINASAAEFRQNDFAERLLDRVRAAGIPTRYLELEVTETVFLGRGSEYVGRALHRLSGEGVRIALDDFGTGYASLSHLKQFPVDIIKIDQSFVRDLAVNPDDSAIIRALVGLGKSLSIGIVAEGIEDRAQAAFLAELGCDYGQGYLFCRAIAAADVPDLLSKWRRRKCVVVPLREQKARDVRDNSAAPAETKPAWGLGGRRAASRC